MATRRRSQRRATPAMAWVAWSRRSGSTPKSTSRPCLRRSINPASSSTTRCLETAWRVKGTWSARELALASPCWTRRSSTRRRDGSATAVHSASSGSVGMLALSRLGQCAGEAVEEDAPAVGVLLGVLGLVDVLALERVEGALGDPQAGVVALGGGGEIHEERVGGRGRPAGRGEDGEAAWWGRWGQY